MMSIFISLLFATVLVAVHGQSSLNSYCRHSSGSYISGSGIECNTGDIFLRGMYIELGIHNVGSYGTSGDAPSGYATPDVPLGLVADFNQDGWTNANTCDPFCARYAGDYFTPGVPVEGICNALKTRSWQ